MQFPRTATAAASAAAARLPLPAQQQQHQRFILSSCVRLLASLAKSSQSAQSAAATAAAASQLPKQSAPITYTLPHSTAWPVLQVSSPHPVSNIRLLRLPASLLEQEQQAQQAQQHSSDETGLPLTSADMDWLRVRIAMQERHHAFWTDNNNDFFARKSDFERTIAETQGRPATAHELSVFYKEYLEMSYERHAVYNRELWRDNIAMLVPGVQAELRAIGRQSLLWAERTRELAADARYYTGRFIRRVLAASDFGGYRAHGVTVR
ncbi:hypothetical protein BC831DRAFT_476029 [Entophlyctis helioformis]|nr:hypothetical protein BC831DRAFT_476029 [Entophlyctis helioformis]